MVHSYVRAEDGTIRRIFNFDGDLSHRESMIQFKKHHFAEAGNMLVPSNPKQAIDVKDLDVRGAPIDGVWELIKQEQFTAKGNGTKGFILVQFINADETFFFKLLLVALRLRVEYDTECEDGLPDVRFIVSEQQCMYIARWLKAFTPTQQETVLPIRVYFKGGVPPGPKRGMWVH